MRRTFFQCVVLTVVLTLLFGCGNELSMSREPEIPAEEVPLPMRVFTPAPVPIPTSPPSRFADPAVRYVAELIRGKEEIAFIAEDWAVLEAMEYLEIDSSHVARNYTLQDLPGSFQNLRGLHMSRWTTDEADGVLRADDCAVLAGMELRFVNIYASGFSSLDFCRDIQYVQLSIATRDGDIEPEGTADLADASVLGGAYIRECMEGNVRGYTKAIDGDITVELVKSDMDKETDEDYLFHEMELFVSRRNEEGYACIQNIKHVPLNIHGDGVYLADVNFDGQKDIVVCDGVGGASYYYSAYLRCGETFVADGQFTQIPSPSIDEKNKKVLGSWRSSAASHGWGIYEWRDGALVEIARLTIEWRRSDGNSDEGVIIHEEERLVDGVMQTTAFFTAYDKTEEELDAWLYGPDSYWRLYCDSWESFKYAKCISDFGIDSYDYINYMEAQLLK